MKQIPESKQEAVDMNLNPCDYCDTGWACYSKNFNESCYDTCKYKQEYYNKRNKRWGKWIKNYLLKVQQLEKLLL